MATNMALKRAAKANRRKAVLAEKRKSELLAATLPEKVRRAVSAPVQHCLLSAGLFECGIGTLVLARGVTTEHLNCGVFLLDVFCLGIKDVFFRSIPSEALEELAMGVALEPIESSYARKLLRDLAVWAQTIGFAPARDFAVVERLFGEVSAEECYTAFQFGREGKPLYIQGPFDSPAALRNRVA